MASPSVKIKVGADVKAAIDAFDKLGKHSMKIGSGFGKMGDSMGRAFDPLMRGLTRAATAITATVAAATAAVLKVGGDFELSMARVAGVSGAAGEELAKLEEKARQLGETLPITASEAADAMYNLAQAGMKTNEILVATQAVTGLSIAQNYDLSESAKLLVTALRTYNMESSESMRIADIFNNAISSSMLSMEKLGEALKQVAPIASKAGVSFEDMVAMMGKLSDAGLDGSMIGTGLRKVLSSLLGDEAKTIATLKKLGVSARDTNGKLRPMIDIFKDLAAAGMDAADSIALFDIRGSVAGLTLAANADSLDEYSAELGKLGKTQVMLDKMMATFVNRLKAVKSALEETLIIFFGDIQERAKGATDAIRDLVLEFNKWAKGTQVLNKVTEAFFKGLNIGIKSATEFEFALKNINVEGVAQRFQDFGEGINSLTKSLSALFNAVPWKTLADNLELIVKTIIAGWVTGKVMKAIHVISLFTQEMTALAAFLAANPIVVALVAVATAAGLVISKMGELEDAQKEALKAEQYAIEMEQTQRDYQDALDGNLEALSRLPEKYADVVKARLKLGRSTEEEERQLQTIEERTKALERPMGAHAADIEKLSKLYREGAITLEEYNERMNTLADTIRKSVQAAANPELKDYSTVGKAFEDAITAAIDKIRVFKANAATAITQFGMKSKDAGEMLKTQITDEISEAAKKLEKEFGPAVAKAFIEEIGNKAEAGGDKMVFELTSAFLRIQKAAQEITQGIQFFGSSQDGFLNTTMREAARKYAEAFGEPFENVYGQKFEMDYGLNTEQITANIESLGPVGTNVGDTIGKGLYDGITSWVEQAVNNAKSKLSSIKVPGLSGDTANLAAAVNQAGRGI